MAKNGAPPERCGNFLQVEDDWFFDCDLPKGHSGSLCVATGEDFTRNRKRTNQPVLYTITWGRAITHDIPTDESALALPGTESEGR